MKTTTYIIQEVLSKRGNTKALTALIISPILHIKRGLFCASFFCKHFAFHFVTWALGISSPLKRTWFTEKSSFEHYAMWVWSLIGQCSELETIIVIIKYIGHSFYSYLRLKTIKIDFNSFLPCCDATILFERIHCTRALQSQHSTLCYWCARGLSPHILRDDI